MNGELSFCVEGVPKPKERPRKGRNGHFYTPTKTQEWEESIAWMAKQAVSKARYHERKFLREEMLSVSLDIMAKVRGDIDNLAKAFLDAMNGIVYDDDRRVKGLHIRVLEPYPSGPCTIVTLRAFRP